jgi:hypothetical protein
MRFGYDLENPFNIQIKKIESMKSKTIVSRLVSEDSQNQSRKLVSEYVSKNIAGESTNPGHKIDPQTRRLFHIYLQAPEEELTVLEFYCCWPKDLVMPIRLQKN